MNQEKENQMFQFHMIFLRYQVAMRRKSMTATDPDTKRHFETFADQFYRLAAECVTYLEYADTAEDKTKHLRCAVCLSHAYQNARDAKNYNIKLSRQYNLLDVYFHMMAEKWYALIPESAKKPPKKLEDSDDE